MFHFERNYRSNIKAHNATGQKIQWTEAATMPITKRGTKKRKTLVGKIANGFLDENNATAPRTNYAEAILVCHQHTLDALLGHTVIQNLVGKLSVLRKRTDSGRRKQKSTHISSTVCVSFASMTLYVPIDALAIRLNCFLSAFFASRIFCWG